MIITTEICKAYLAAQFSSTIKTQWKRVSKYKNSQGHIEREFSHPNQQNIKLEEVSGQLRVVGSIPLLNNIPPASAQKFNFEAKVFSASELEGARKLLFKIIQSQSHSGGDSEQGLEKIFKSPDWFKYKHSLGSQFTFYFPKETSGNEQTQRITGLEASMYDENEESWSESFCFVLEFKDKQLNELVDWGWNDVWRYQTMMPEYIDFLDECNIGVTCECKINVGQMVELLLSLGIDYGANKDCVFRKHILNYQKIVADKQRLEESLMASTSVISGHKI